MGMGKLCIAKKLPTCGHGDTLHCQKTLPKTSLYMGMATLCIAKKLPIYGHGGTCTAKKLPTYGHGDTLHCQKAPNIWEWGHFALPKSPLHMGMACLPKTTHVLPILGSHVVK